MYANLNEFKRSVGKTLLSIGIAKLCRKLSETKQKCETSDVNRTRRNKAKIKETKGNV